MKTPTLTAVKSSQLEAIGHDPVAKKLFIRFKAKDEKPGSVYEYENVSTELYNSFKTAKSIGSYFYKNIKPHSEKHPYKKVAE